MTFKSYHKVVYLLVVGLLLAMMVVPVTATFFDSSLAADDAPQFTLFQSEVEPVSAIACSCGDPGGSQGGGCC